MTIHVVGDRGTDDRSTPAGCRSRTTRRAPSSRSRAASAARARPDRDVRGQRFNIATTASTTFVPACGDLKSGNKVKVRHAQADGSVRATSVTRRGAQQRVALQRQPA
jgi:hypothetical protein